MPPVGFEPTISVETSTWQHTTVTTDRHPCPLWDSGLQSQQRPLPDNTQHSQQTDIHALCGIRAYNLSRRAAADPRLRPRTPWDQQATFLRTLNNNKTWTILITKVQQIFPLQQYVINYWPMPHPSLICVHVFPHSSQSLTAIRLTGTPSTRSRTWVEMPPVASPRFSAPISCIHCKVAELSLYCHAPHNDVSVNDGPPIRWWCHKTITL